LEKIFNHFVGFAINFNKLNVIMVGRPIDQLKTEPIAKAIKVMKAFTKNIEYYQALFASITVYPSVVIRYSAANTINNTNASPPVVTPAQNDSDNSKRNPNTPLNTVIGHGILAGNYLAECHNSLNCQSLM
jgi:hypothetical protein